MFTAHWSSCYTKLNTITAFLLNVPLWYFILMEETIKRPPCNKKWTKLTKIKALVLVTSFTSRTEFYTFAMVKMILKMISHCCEYFFFLFLELHRYVHVPPGSVNASFCSTQAMKSSNVLYRKSTITSRACPLKF